MQLAEIHAEFISATQAMRLLGISRQALAWRSAHMDGFPEPEGALFGALLVYRRRAVLDWLAAHPRRRRGRP